MERKNFLNYADDKIFADVCEWFGGRTYLEEKYPQIWRLLLNTREWHQTLTEDAFGDGEVPLEPSDVFRVEEVPCYGDEEERQAANDKGEVKHYSAVYTESITKLTEPASYIHMSSQIFDPESGKVFAAYAVSDSQNNELKKSVRVGRELLSYTRDVTVKTETDFIVVKQHDGKPVIASEEHKVEDKINLSDMQSDIREIVVSDPPLADGDAVTRVVYNRSDKDAAYSFSKAGTSKSDRKYVNVYFPFNVTVKLQDYCEFDTEKPVEIDPQCFFLSMYSDVIYVGDDTKYGEVQFNTSEVYMKKLQYELAEDKKSLTFKFPYSSDTTDNYWGVDMPLTSSQKQGDFDFYLGFKINYINTEIGNHPLNTNIIVASSDDYPASDNLRKVRKIHITWGCLAAGTEIRMASGGQKKIEAIQVGDVVRTKDGISRVCNKVRGYETHTIHLETEKNPALFLTEKHPIATDRGIIYAEDLTPGDRILGEDGAYQKITYLDIELYNGSVYSLELQSPSLIYANGMAVGDYQTLPDAGEPAVHQAEPLAAELLAELDAWTEERDKRMREKI